MKSLIIGAGQVGTALYEVLSSHYQTEIRDVDEKEVRDVEVLHICYPDDAGFAEYTKAYVEKYQPGLVIIHSSVKVGTTAKCGNAYVYSPVRGRHPNLAKEMKSFVKFVASRNKSKAKEAVEYFENCGWPTLMVDSPESLEFFKVLSNVHMGLEIAWRQEVERIMQGMKLDPSEYEKWEQTYRDGCMEVGDYNLIRPIMKPDPIGGHCILPCTEILRAQVESKLIDFIVESNERAKNDCCVAQGG